MISSIQGILEAVGSDHVVVRVGGVGFHVNVPSTAIETLGPEGQPVTLYTTFLVRDDVPTLFGFPRAEERRLFDLLLGVSGVGPRLALELLATLDVNDAVVAIVSGNTDALASVSGIGKRTAGRIVVDLQAKLEREWEAAAVGATDSRNDVAMALQALGYSAAEALRAVTALGDVAELPLEEQVRMALQQMAQE
ncbi:MAG: Holliday junction branch migration protein RuvA [Chloroflexi bacterium]|nr:Holliday junction branch migration protein RuvA [Chloroflexota bacterium]